MVNSVKGQSILQKILINLRYRLVKPKDCFSIFLVIVSADNSLPFILETDASEIALGAVVSQSVGEMVCPVSFYSRSLTVPELN